MRARGFGGSLIARRFGLRTSLAGRLLAGGIVFTALVIAGVSGFLLVSRSQQTNAGALSNADNRAGVAGQLIARVIQPQAQYAATNTASLTSMQLAMSGKTPANLVAAEFTQNRVVDVPGLEVVILDNHGGVLYTSECDGTSSAGAPTHPATAICEQSATPHVTSEMASVRDALQVAATSACQQPSAAIAANPSSAARCPSGVEGVEPLAGGLPALDVVVPVFNVQAGSFAPLGVVVYSAPLRTQFARFGPVIGYTPVFLRAGADSKVIRFMGSADTPALATAPASIAGQLSTHALVPSSGVAARAIYTVAGVGAVAGSFVPLAAPGGTRVAGYIGVEVPLALFAAGTAQDEGTIAQIAFTALVVMCVLVLLFVDRFVRRPVARLERGVGRIAAGDYTTDIPVTSRDELGRLAAGVNSMREQIAGYIKHIDGSVGQLQEVSRALTTTTGGIEELQDAVLAAADAIAGGSTSATVYTKRGAEILRMRSRGPEMPDIEDMPVDELTAGRSVRLVSGGRAAIAVPMLFQEALTGVLVVASDRPVAESDERALITLANNAAVAVENTRTLEQEREAVRRLRELNQLKSDFLDTAQHELRTPVVALQGQIELLNVAWDKWDEATRLDIVRDVDISVKLLGETVENIVDFALVNSDTINVRMAAVDVAASIRDAASDVRRHFKDELPVELTIDVRGTPTVNADPFRFRQVLRALIDNAVKFTPEGGHVTVSARREKGSVFCRIEVTDDGIGISPEAIPRLFDRFYQEDSSRTRRHGGLGMGLALVRRLCDAHEATVQALSDGSGGSRFIILWPLAGSKPQPAPADFVFEAATSAG
ncbi:MAG TPA: ATP-binding protein [Candidatus Dormibacteraeota bacterium]|jgi:signal transduction histidine kinase